MQQIWVSKLLGYEFVVEFKKGQENKVADALSRRNEDDMQTASLVVISFPSLEWFVEV
jgi:1,4-alpha-glucan branching enzyme